MEEPEEGMRSRYTSLADGGGADKGADGAASSASSASSAAAGGKKLEDGADGGSVASTVANDDNEEPAELGRVERFFDEVYVPAFLRRITIGSFSVKLLPLCFVLVLAGYAVFSAVFAAQLRPPTSEEEWFPDQHMWTGVNDYSRVAFFSSASDNYVEISLVFGITGTRAGRAPVADRSLLTASR